MNRRLVGEGLNWYMEIEDMGGEAYEYEMILANSVEYILPVHMMEEKFSSV